MAEPARRGADLRHPAARQRCATFATRPDHAGRTLQAAGRSRFDRRVPSRARLVPRPVSSGHNARWDAGGQLRCGARSAVLGPAAARLLTCTSRCDILPAAGAGDWSVAMALPRWYSATVRALVTPARWITVSTPLKASASPAPVSRSPCANSTPCGRSRLSLSGAPGSGRRGLARNEPFYQMACR